MAEWPKTGRIAMVEKKSFAEPSPKAIQEVISVSLSEGPGEHLISSNVIEISKQAATFFFSLSTLLCVKLKLGSFLIIF